MRKILAFLLTVMLLAGFCISASAAEFSMECGTQTLKSGDTFTVVVTLDETIPTTNNVTCVQGELYYNPEVLTYVSHAMADDYTNYASKHREDKQRIQFSYLSMDFSEIEVPAGKVISVTFLVNQDIAAEYLMAELHLEMAISTKTAQTTKSDTSLSIALEKEETLGDHVDSSDEESKGDDKNPEQETNNTVPADDGNTQVSDDTNNAISTEATESEIRNNEPEQGAEENTVAAQDQEVSLMENGVALESTDKGTQAAVIAGCALAVVLAVILILKRICKREK